ncbi:MAG: hypothetical protein A2Y76_04305 [Planctomycetes bacterium RBG_13_60_9]|nr:MAG: hypothetical protein A2Y76_04305 [Planctomycetes bacterium RBG_13_60_9]
MPNRALQSVDFVLANGRPATGLVPVSGKESDERGLPIDERAAILDAKSFELIDYVFFRRFTDGRSSQVAAYIVDNSDEKHDERQLARLHHQVWLQGRAPLLYVTCPTRIDVLACARGPDFWDKGKHRYNPAETLHIAAEISDHLDKLSRFSALRLADGTFWDDPSNRGLANHDKAAHRLLIQAVVDADRLLDGKRNPVLRRMLLLMVLIKYLEDRNVFPGNGWFGKYHKGARTFFDVLKGGQPDEVYRLLETLRRRFNGDVFDLSIIRPTALTRDSLKAFADLVEARTLKKQRYLWDQFSFEHLPVEIISHLYQRFVQGGHGAVYTPPFLAALLLDHAMPYTSLSGNERILDPACGSGVFLVGAFRRLINAWRSRNGWKRPTVSRLKGMLKRSIFGIDLDPNAIDLTAFSLSLAMCDALQPDVIWRDLKFDRLRGRSLLEGDFFSFCLAGRKGSSAIRTESFHIVIGNPPFESELTPDGKKVDEATQEERQRDFLPDQQTAYLFLEQGLAFLRRDDGRICLIQPHGFLYNRNVDAFRRKIFETSKVEAILDFVSIRKLYEADPKTVAVLARAGKPGPRHAIAHWTFRRTMSTKERISFELDHYDRHTVPKEQAEKEAFVWRANLLGGGRTVDMSRRFQNARTLAEYIGKKGWDYGEGFTVGNRRRRAPFLKDKDLLPTEGLTSTGIDSEKLTKVTGEHFECPRHEDRFTAPLVLIKEVESLPVAFWDQGFLAYPHEIVGIHSPKKEDESELRELFEFLRTQRDVLRVSASLRGSRSLIMRSTAILKLDIDGLPYPEEPEALAFSFWEQVIQHDILKYMGDYVRLGQNSALLRQKAGNDDVRAYSEVFCRMLGSVYETLRASVPIFLNGLICQPFYFGDPPDAPWLGSTAEGELHRLIYHESHEALRTIRVFRYYQDNVILIVKPDRLRYWIGSTAIRDADETLVDLRRQGY